VTGHGTVAARVINISEGGASLHAGTTLPIGAKGAFTLDGTDITLPFFVRHAKDGVLGVAFELDAAATATLQSVLARLGARLAA
jgi:hypothetical protein